MKRNAFYVLPPVSSLAFLVSRHIHRKNSLWRKWEKEWQCMFAADGQMRMNKKIDKRCSDRIARHDRHFFDIDHEWQVPGSTTIIISTIIIDKGFQGHEIKKKMIDSVPSNNRDQMNRWLVFCGDIFGKIFLKMSTDHRGILWFIYWQFLFCELPPSKPRRRQFSSNVLIQSTTFQWRLISFRPRADEYIAWKIL